MSADPEIVTTPSAEHKPNRAGQMLPGISGICMFLIFMTMLNVYAALQGAFGPGAARSVILLLCTLLAVGIFGLLRLKKWGWSLVTAGCLLFSSGTFSSSRRRTHLSFSSAASSC